jgi:hypothetical protein
MVGTLHQLRAIGCRVAGTAQVGVARCVRPRNHRLWANQLGVGGIYENNSGRVPLVPLATPNGWKEVEATIKKLDERIDEKLVPYRSSTNV